VAVRVVTDSVADLPPQVAQELGIAVVPINVRFGTEVYRDGIDLTTEQFYERLKHSQTLPLTSVPTPAAYAEVYNKLAEETEEILVVAVSAKLSGTYAVALQSVGLLKRKCRVEVLDSRCAVMAQGFIAITAARAAQAGASLDEVLATARRNMPRVDFRAAFDTLEYLKRGGRIGKAQALLGSMLKVNPIIALREGEVFPIGRERSRAKAVEHLYKFATSYARVEGLAVEYAADVAEAERLIKRLSANFPKEIIYRTRPSPAIGTHTGPGLLVVSVLGDRT
jgi:DegV family protein with EDD domain